MATELKSSSYHSTCSIFLLWASFVSFPRQTRYMLVLSFTVLRYIFLQTKNKHRQSIHYAEFSKCAKFKRIRHKHMKVCTTNFPIAAKNYMFTGSEYFPPWNLIFCDNGLVCSPIPRWAEFASGKIFWNLAHLLNSVWLTDPCMGLCLFRKRKKNLIDILPDIVEVVH